MEKKVEPWKEKIPFLDLANPHQTPRPEIELRFRAILGVKPPNPTATKMAPFQAWLAEI